MSSVLHQRIFAKMYGIMRNSTIAMYAVLSVSVLKMLGAESVSTWGDDMVRLVDGGGEGEAKEGTHHCPPSVEFISDSTTIESTLNGWGSRRGRTREA